MKLLQNPPNNNNSIWEEDDEEQDETIHESLNSMNNNEEADCTSNCSTPYVSAPSSPTNNNNPSNDLSYYFSCPASPMHYITSSFKPSVPTSSSSCDFSPASLDFDFSSRFSSSVSISTAMGSSMSSADELFLNGKIRPQQMLLSPLLFDNIADEPHEEDDDNETVIIKGRDFRMRNKSLHRRARSLSPFRNPHDDDDDDFRVRKTEHGNGGGGGGGGGGGEVMDSVSVTAIAPSSSTETTPSVSASSSRSSSSGTSSKKWEFLKDFLMGSKTEGRGNGKEKFWSSFGETQNHKRVQNQQRKKPPPAPPPAAAAAAARPSNGVGKRRNISSHHHHQSAHEIHYRTNRAQAEEMRRKTFLPYRQGLIGCLGFSWKSYGAMNGFARVLNPVSSR